MTEPGSDGKNGKRGPGRRLALLVPLLLLGARTPELHVYRIVAARSNVYVVTHKSGLLSFLGHEHAIVPTDWSGTLCLGDPLPVGAHGSITVRVASLVIDSDSARSLAGLGGGPGPDDRRAIQAKMLDSAHLDVVRYPEVRIALSAAGPERDGRVPARGRITLRGVEREVEIPLELRRGESAGLQLAGDLRIRQRDFGVEPESIHGVVKVSNDVDLHFLLAATPTEARCDPVGGGS